MILSVFVLIVMGSFRAQVRPIGQYMNPSLSWPLCPHLSASSGFHANAETLGNYIYIYIEFFKERCFGVNSRLL